MPWSGAPVFDGPVETYSLEELERRVINRLQVQEKWRNLSPSTFISRKFRLEPGSFGRFHLLPGGRWLLDNIDGRVYVFDLDNLESTPHFLFEEREGYYFNSRIEDPLSNSAVWIDSSKHWLSLRIALHNDATAHDYGMFPHQCYFFFSGDLQISLFRGESNLDLSIGLHEPRLQPRLDRKASRQITVPRSL